MERLEKSYPLTDSEVGPVLYVVMTDNWIEATLRYMVDARARRPVQADLHRALLQRYEAEDTITVASATFDIVGFPPLRGEFGTMPAESNRHSGPQDQE